MKKTLIITGLLLGVSALFYFAKRQIDQLSSAKFKVRRIRKVETKDGIALIGYDLEISNESHVKVTMKNLNVDVFSGQNKVGEVRYSNPIKIPAQGTVSIPLETSINAMALLKALSGSLKDLLSAKSVSLLFRISVDARLLGVTLNKMTFDTLKKFEL
tara:strand:- start:3298 stop:3771 length:474 start_codon:yes stop_codon:yes gene_type:complete